MTVRHGPVDTLHMSDETLVQERIDELLAKHDPKSTPVEEFLGTQFDLGLGWVHFPVGNGGLDVAPGLQRAVNEQLAAVRAPVAAMRNAIGFGMAAPTIATHGTEAQRARVPPSAVHRRGGVVPALQRAGRGFRCRRSVDAGRARR